MDLVPAHVEGGGGEHAEHVREDGLQHRVQTRGGGVQLQAGHIRGERADLVHTDLTTGRLHAELFPGLLVMAHREARVLRLPARS